MKFIYRIKHELSTMKYFDLSGEMNVEASCVVRTDKGQGRDHRALADPDEVVYAMDGDRYNPKPYMPRQFPRGVWNVKRPYEVDREDPEYKYKGPWFIPTDASVMVQVWDVDEDGGYKAPTGTWVRDWGYGLHFSESRTTLGCINILRLQQLMQMKVLIDNAIDRNEGVLLEVV